MTRTARRMTRALAWLLLALALVDCGKYGRPSRVRPSAPGAAPAVSAPAPAEACEQPKEEETP